MTNDKQQFGINKTNRKVITCIVFLILLLFGSIEPYGIVIRIAYLIIIPLIIWYGIFYLGGAKSGFKINNEYLNRALASAIAGALLVGAYLAFTSPYHPQCDQYAGHGDNTECVGDYVRASGPDKAAGVLQLVVSGIAFWYAVSEKTEGQD